MKASELLHVARFWRHLRYHRDILKHIRWTDVDAKRLAFYRTLINSGDLVFDIGANMGNRSKIFRKLAARVVAFEPQSYCNDFLAVAFCGDPDFTLDRSALSDEEGETKLYIGEAHTLSTLDTDWISRMNDGGRFSKHRWNESETVSVSTLDNAITRYGQPDFIKIDVEGHEASVLKGLTAPVKALSIEFASEGLDSTFRCIDHLETLADYEYRLSMEETMKYEGTSWSRSHEIVRQLKDARTSNPLVWGDLYARRTETRQADS